MKRTLLYIMMAAALSACGHRASNTGIASSSDVEFATDSIGSEQEDSMACVKVSIDWPTGSHEALVESVRQYICEELATNPTQEGTPKVILFDNGQTAVDTIVSRQYQELMPSWKEAYEQGYGAGMPYSYYQRIFMLEDNEQYVTYISRTEGFTGGAHGYATVGGITFRKNDGMRICYRTEYNKEQEIYETKEQTLFADTESPELYTLIKEGVRSYFLEFDEEMTTDEQLNDMLITVDDVNHIPLPSKSPHFTKKGLCFVYQQYEIAPYAAGMVNFVIPYDKVRPFLTKEALSLIK